jgi:hypothetical protein
MYGVSGVPEAKFPRPMGAAVAAMLAIALGACSSDPNGFSINDLNPLKGNDPLRAADYNYFYKRDSSGVGPVMAADLVGPDGRCAFEAMPAAPAAPYPPAPGAAPASEAAAEPINPRSNSVLYFTAGPQANTQAGLPQNPGIPPEVRNGPRGVALAMTECQVVQLAGYTDRVEIGAEGGRRSVTLTYMSGTRPGIYRFRDGRLVSMERVEGLPEPKKPKPAPRKTKTAKSKQPT